MKNRTLEPHPQASPDTPNGIPVYSTKRERHGEPKDEKARKRAALATWNRLHGGRQ